MSWIFGGKEKKEVSKETEKETSAHAAAIAVAPLTGDSKILRTIYILL
jgi:hypothetical protein